MADRQGRGMYTAVNQRGKFINTGQSPVASSSKRALIDIVYMAQGLVPGDWFFAYITPDRPSQSGQAVTDIISTALKAVLWPGRSHLHGAILSQT